MMKEERIGWCGDGAYGVRDGSEGTRFNEPRHARSVAPAFRRVTSHAPARRKRSVAGFTITATTHFSIKMAASIWHKYDERCRELASPNIFNFGLSV